MRFIIKQSTFVSLSIRDQMAEYEISDAFLLFCINEGYKRMHSRKIGHFYDI